MAFERGTPGSGAAYSRGASERSIEDRAHRYKTSTNDEGASSEVDQALDEISQYLGTKQVVTVEIPPFARRDEYLPVQGETTVQHILRESEEGGELHYEVRFGDNHTEVISFEQLVNLKNGSVALARHHEAGSPGVDGGSTSEGTENDRIMVTTRGSSKTTNARKPGFIDPTTIVLSSSDDDDDAVVQTARRSDTRTRPSGRGKLRTLAIEVESEHTGSGDDSSSASQSDERPRRRRSSRMLTRRSTSRAEGSLRRLGRRTGKRMDEDEGHGSQSSSSEAFIPFLQSDVLPASRKRRRVAQSSQPRLVIGGLNFDKAPRAGTRRSGRATRHQRNMEEATLDDIYRSGSEPTNSAAKPLTVKEVFKVLPRDNEFRLRHCQHCDTCGNGPSAGQLVYCQGCVLAYHKSCLGNRHTRDHLVTKVGVDDFVLQCRRCINGARRKEATAPKHSLCQICLVAGPSCAPFRERKTALQEQKERDENGGEDPVADVDTELINNAANVLFRCLNCWRAFHLSHLKPLSSTHMDLDEGDEEIADRRFQEYSQEWKCEQCLKMPAKVSGLIAWRPKDEEGYIAGFTCDMMDEDEKEYLVKWEKMSYFRASWMPGAWAWGVTASAMRKAFIKKDQGPKMRTEDAIPEEYLRIDIILDVRYTSIVDIRTEEVDKARIKEVDEALIKYKGLGYEDAVWEKVPIPEDGERWTDFVTAYNDWVLGRHVHLPKSAPLKVRVEKARAQPFSKLEKTKQPDNLIGGELMKYQLDGLNWLYYRWHSRKNGILADEMGLGKTIQVIGLLATLVQDHKCFPFMIVVPNSTCANWRREIKQWVPSLRVVTYFGSSASRNLAYQYELYPEGSKELRCHVVVTSYDAAADESCRKFFKSVPWVGLIVDEGQRLKNDRSLLYEALNALKVGFKVMLTGTPLQNNARELFNLLQFLDDSFNAAELEVEYADLTKDKLHKLHDLIRPFFLRRTKAQVLTFLPPMAQIIVPVSMSLLQKKLYKSILAKNPELLRAIFTTNRTLKPAERANLSNILMQLRKCLCHPFVYSREIEERTEVAAVSHRNLVEASSKLQLLELMLPKLRERGHRVLIFSQFLDMLNIVEDFLDGLGLPYQRLDGTISSLQKQKRIDEFNAPDSPLFAFLLSTRAGGVGINLATADTVIILDPDFNPHQDIQALSRAHRIGQKKKVLCFQLVTRASSEEKIMQIGRKKMALDHVVVEQMEAEESTDLEVESMLRHGAAELFGEDSGDHEIRYDSASVDKLLDRSQMENTSAGEDRSAESQFSFARVWANDQGTLQESLNDFEEEQAPDLTVWDKILKERERAAAAEAAARDQALGRGKRARLTVDYAGFIDGGGSPEASRKERRDEETDTDFRDEQSAHEQSAEEEEGDPILPNELDTNAGTKQRRESVVAAPAKPKPSAKPFKRAAVSYPSPNVDANQKDLKHCAACLRRHAVGYCPMKLAGPEFCNLCGLAHYGHSRTCPHLNSETQVREMLEALKQSPEPRHLVEAATKYLRGVKGHLVSRKKKAAGASGGGDVNGVSSTLAATNGHGSAGPARNNANGHGARTAADDMASVEERVRSLVGAAVGR